MTYPIYQVFVISQSAIHLLWLLSGVEVIPLKINLYASLLKLEGNSNIWLQESWPSEFIVAWTGKDFLNFARAATTPMHLKTVVLDL